MSSEIGEVSQEIAQVSREMRDVNPLIGQVHRELGEVHPQTGQVHREIGKVNREMRSLNQEIGQVHREMGHWHPRIGEVHREIAKAGQGCLKVRPFLDGSRMFGGQAPPLPPFGQPLLHSEWRKRDGERWPTFHASWHEQKLVAVEQRAAEHR